MEIQTIVYILNFALYKFVSSSEAVHQDESRQERHCWHWLSRRFCSSPSRECLSWGYGSWPGISFWRQPPHVPRSRASAHSFDEVRFLWSSKTWPLSIPPLLQMETWQQEPTMGWGSAAWQMLGSTKEEAGLGVGLSEHRLHSMLQML